MSTELVKEESKKLFLPKQILQGYGCRSCVWKTFHQCPSGFTEQEEFLDEGYCQELVGFIFSLAEPDDKISAVKEKFNLYIQEMQAMQDHVEFTQYMAEYKRCKAMGINKKELAQMHYNAINYRLWWTGLSSAVVRGLARIADREQKQQQAENPTITIQQLNILLKESSNKLKEIENKEGNDGGV